MDLIRSLLLRRHFTTRGKTPSNQNNTRRFSISFDLYKDANLSLKMLIVINEFSSNIFVFLNVIQIFSKMTCYMNKYKFEQCDMA